MNNNFLEVAISAINTIHEMNEECERDFDCAYEENFPANAFREITINGKKYKMKIEIELKEI